MPVQTRNQKSRDGAGGERGNKEGSGTRSGSEDGSAGRGRDVGTRALERGIRPSTYASTYYDPSLPGSYGGVTRLREAVGGTVKGAQEWLAGEEAYTRHKPSLKRLKTDQIVVNSVDAQWSTDLADMQHLARDNDGIRYLLVVIDSLSRYAWVRALPDKTGQTVASALRDIFTASKRAPRTIRSDLGGEFRNYFFQKLLRERGIQHFLANHRTKAAIAERFIRTLKTKLWRFFTATNTRRYIDKLDQFVEGYNNTKHSTTGLPPAHVTIYNSEDVWLKLYGHRLGKRSHKSKPKFKAGDRVRVSTDKAIFDKGYSANWSSEIFMIKAIKGGMKAPFRYILQDEGGEDIVGVFKEEELQLVKVRKKIVSRVLKKRGSDGRRAVNWRGYPRELVTWLE